MKWRALSSESLVFESSLGFSLLEVMFLNKQNLLTARNVNLVCG